MLCRHLWKLAEFAHEALVNPVFPLPHPFARKAQPAARSHGVFVTRADECEPTGLRFVRLQSRAAYCATQIFGQRFALAHGKYTGFFQLEIDHAGDVARRINQRVVDGLQCVFYFDETFRIELQAQCF